MSRTISRRLLAQSPLTATKESSQVFSMPLRYLRPFSNTPRRTAEEDDIKSPAQETVPLPRTPRAIPKAASPPPVSSSLHPKATSSLGSMAGLANLFAVNQNDRIARQTTRWNPLASSTGDNLLAIDGDVREEIHLFSVYATRHNTHINVSRPQTEKEKRESSHKGLKVMISISAGNLGFRKSARKHYDSAFQTAAYVMARMQERGMNQQINKLEVHLRGFGAGREAVTKALLGSEGRFLRGKIVKVADNTRLKFGGTRSRKPRRLG